MQIPLIVRSSFLFHPAEVIFDCFHWLKKALFKISSGSRIYEVCMKIIFSRKLMFYLVLLFHFTYSFVESEFLLPIPFFDVLILNQPVCFRLYPDIVCLPIVASLILAYLIIYSLSFIQQKLLCVYKLPGIVLGPVILKWKNNRSLFYGAYILVGVNGDDDKYINKI